MGPREKLTLAICASSLMSAFAWGCGSGRPPDETIYYDPSLRPGVVAAADPSEIALLASLAGSEEAIEHEGVVVDPVYTAASGRRCRRIREASRTRLACDGDDGWVFVPEVLGGSE